MIRTATLEDVAHEELRFLWGDLHRARREAANGQWSIACEGIEHRIKALTLRVGPTPWEQLNIELIEDGIYQRIHQELGIEAPYDADGVREHRAYLNQKARERL